MKRLCLWLIRLILFAVLARSADAAEEVLTVAAAANVQFALAELQADFTLSTGIGVRTVLGSSGKITAQIERGAPFDVFLAADMSYPQTLYQQGLAAGPPQLYAYGALVLWTMEPLDLGRGLNVLADEEVTRVALADPKLAPYGRAAFEALEHAGLIDEVTPKAVFGESISQVNQYVYSTNVAAGFTAKSVVLSPAMQGKGRWIEVAQDTYTPIAQGVVILKHADATASAAARRFVDYLRSRPAKAILARYGYRLP